MKKMRRLIPAIAMLLVSAVMLSTASFAWFTLNDEVTASGMQIQAKASGSLLISQAPFTAENLGTADVEINAAVKTLKPMAYHDLKAGTDAANMGTLNLNTTTYATAGWYKPQDNSVSNTVTGSNNGAYNTPYDTLSQYTFREEFYIATAGNTMKGDFTIKLTSPVHPETGETHKAYSVALYVIEKTDANKNTTWADNGNVTFSTDAPTVILHVDETDDRNTVTLENVTIPSISGTADGADEVGLKVIAYFYVDGELQAPGVKNVILGYVHSEPAGAYDALNTYYAFTAVALDDASTTDQKEGLAAGDDLTGLFYKDGEVYKPAYGVYATTDTKTYCTRSLAPLTNDDKDPEKTATLAGKGYYVISEKKTMTGDDNSTDGVIEESYVVTVSEPQAVTQELPYSYVRSADIPSNGSFLTLAFSAEVKEE